MQLYNVYRKSLAKMKLFNRRAKPVKHRMQDAIKHFAIQCHTESVISQVNVDLRMVSMAHDIAASNDFHHSISHTHALTYFCCTLFGLIHIKIIIR